MILRKGDDLKGTETRVDFLYPGIERLADLAWLHFGLALLETFVHRGACAKQKVFPFPTHVPGMAFRFLQPSRDIRQVTPWPAHCQRHFRWRYAAGSIRQTVQKGYQRCFGRCMPWPAGFDRAGMGTPFWLHTSASRPRSKALRPRRARTSSRKSLRLRSTCCGCSNRVPLRARRRSHTPRIVRATRRRAPRVAWNSGISASRSAKSRMSSG